MLTKFLNNYGFMILGGAMIIGFSAFKGAEVYAGKADSPVTIYFTGDPTQSGQVENEANWSTSSSSPTCSGDDKACSMEVDASDLTSSGKLDPAKIELDEDFTGAGYVPVRNGGNSTTDIEIHNKN